VNERLQMKAVLICLTALMGGGCAPAMKESTDTRSGIPGFCSPDAVQQLIGRPHNKETGEQALRLSGATQLRWITPGDPIAMDYITDRINLETDGRLVLRAYCG
jgi:hypothetical protein